jgi:hypothetical protein
MTTQRAENNSIQTRTNGLHIGITLRSLAHMAGTQQNKQCNSVCCMNNFWSHCMYAYVLIYVHHYVDFAINGHIQKYVQKDQQIWLEDRHVSLRTSS